MLEQDFMIAAKFLLRMGYFADRVLLDLDHPN